MSPAQTEAIIKRFNVFVTTRSMSKNKSVSIDTNTGVEELSEPKVMHTILNNRLKGIPIIHTSVVSHNGGLVLRTAAHTKYRSNNILFKFDILLTKDEQFLESFLSMLEKLASKLGIKKLKIFLNELLFNEISANKLKSVGNKILSKIQILLLNPLRTVNDTVERQKLIKQFHDDPIFGGLGIKG